MIVLVSRSKDTGRFQAFEIKDRVFIEKALEALREDLKRPDKNSGLGLGLSEGHVLVFRDKEGKTTSFVILGDDFIEVDSTRYPAKRTMKVLQDARAGGAVVAISAEEATRLVPSVDDYLR